MKKLLAASAAFILSATAANADMMVPHTVQTVRYHMDAAQPAAPKTEVITFSPGGSVGEFIEHYQKDAEQGVHIVVKGECISACTLMIGLVPPQNVCVSPNAMFGFHSASEELPNGDEKFSLEGTEIVWFTYPVAVRTMLTKLGMGPTKPHPDLVWLPGTLFFHTCSPAEMI